MPADARSMILESERALDSVDRRALVSQEEGQLAQIGMRRDQLVLEIAVESERPLRIPSEVKALQVQLEEVEGGL